MVDNTQNAASPAEAPRELKSTDTSTVKPVLEAVKAKTEVAPEPKAPDVAAVIAEDAEEAGEETSEEGDAPPADAAKPKRKRLSRWMRERVEEARQQAAQETEQRLLQEFQQRQARPEPTNVVPADKPLTREDFDFNEDAYIAYMVQEGIKREKQEEQRKETERKQAADAETFKAKIDTFESRKGAGAWEDIETSPLNTDPAFKPLVDMFLGEEFALDLAHHLATHLDEAKRINALPPLQRAREVAKLAEMFEAPEQAEPPKPLPKKSTNSPPPPKTISGAGKPSVDINSPDLSTEQRIKLWKQAKG